MQESRSTASDRRDTPKVHTSAAIIHSEVHRSSRTLRRRQRIVVEVCHSISLHSQTRHLELGAGGVTNIDRPISGTASHQNGVLDCNAFDV